MTGINPLLSILGHFRCKPVTDRPPLPCVSQVRERFAVQYRLVGWKRIVCSMRQLTHTLLVAAAAMASNTPPHDGSLP